jgi:hypothetical protein
MFQIEADQPKNLLKMVFSGHVTPVETHAWREKLAAILGELRPGFKLLVDFTTLESMDYACAPDIEYAMDLCNKTGVAKIVRVIPDPRRDIGMSIMSLFHYRRGIAIITCQTMEEGLAALAD